MVERPVTRHMTTDLKMSDGAIADAERALAEYHGSDKGGDNNLRRLNLVAFVGERYGSALVQDWKAMRAALVELQVKYAEVVEQFSHEQDATERLCEALRRVESSKLVTPDAGWVGESPALIARAALNRDDNAR